MAGIPEVGFWEYAYTARKPHSEKSSVYQALGAFTVGLSGLSETSFLRREVAASYPVQWAVDDDGEKMWIATPHLASSSFSTRTTIPAVAKCTMLPDCKLLVT